MKRFFPKEYEKQDIEEAADLMSKLLKWVPADRLTCK